MTPEEKAADWIPVTESVPPMLVPVWVCVQEFGVAPAIAIAKRWRGSENRDDTWYLSEPHYGLGNPHPIASTVTHWRPIPKAPTREDWCNV